MGKKGKSKGASPLLHREAYQRMNFLYQAAVVSVSQTPHDLQLSRFYIKIMKSIARKLVIRLDPSIKRVICKSCDSLLIPGVSCTHRLRGHREKHVTVTCLSCGMVKRFLARKQYKLFSENNSTDIV